MTYETTMKKGYYGHKAITIAPLGKCIADGREGERTLEFITSKNDRGEVTTSASVGVNIPCATAGVVMRTTALMGDYYKTFARVAVKPVTEKRIKEAHNSALALLPVAIREAQVFYLKKDGVRVHHDAHGWYIVAPEEQEPESGEALGFDGRPHYADELEAWSVAWGIYSA